MTDNLRELDILLGLSMIKEALMDEKPFVHKLEVKDFWLTLWQPIATCPRDGRRVEVEDAAGDIWLARWFNHSITLSAPGEPVLELKQWREPT